MNKPITIGQSHNLMSILANNVCWDELDAEMVQKKIIENPQEAGRQFTQFLKSGAKTVICLVTSLVLKLIDAFTLTRLVSRKASLESPEKKNSSV